MRFGRKCSSLMLLLALVGGCGSTDDSPSLAVADSSGIQITTNPHPPSAISLRTLSAVPARDIRGDALFQITAIQALPRDHVGVGVGSSGSVLVYDDAGALIRTVGRTGEGPGEFRSIGNLVSMPGDSVGIYDPMLRRLTVFSLTGDFGRVMSLGELAPEGGWSRVLPLDEGLAFVGEAAFATGQEEGPYRRSASSYRIDWDGNVHATYGEFPGTEMFSGNRLFGPFPFGAVLSTATVANGFIVGTGEYPELQIFGPDGELKRLIRWQDEDRSVTQGRMDEFVDFLLESAPPEETAASRERFASMPFADQHPAYAQILSAGEDGTFWVGEYAGPENTQDTRRGPARRWMVFGEDGAMLERVQTPEGFVPFSMSDGLIWGTYRDELDVESVRAYRVDR